MINYFSNLSYFLQKNGIIEKNIKIPFSKEETSITNIISNLLYKSNTKSN